MLFYFIDLVDDAYEQVKHVFEKTESFKEMYNMNLENSDKTGLNISLK